MSKIIIVRHHDGDLDDTATTHLASSNYEIEHWYPFKNPEHVTLPDLAGVSGTIVMGGAQNVTQLDDLRYLQKEIDWISNCIAADLPVIGICLGSQLIAHALGGKVAPHADGLCEFGYEPVRRASNAPKDASGNHWLDDTTHMTQAHFQGFTLPPDCKTLATGDNFGCQAFLHKHNVFAFQFHPEVHSDMFIEWTKADWSNEFYKTPGARPAEQQLTDNAKYNLQQTRWFKQFLDKIFPPLPGAL